MFTSKRAETVSECLGITLSRVKATILYDPITKYRERIVNYLDPRATLTRATSIELKALPRGQGSEDGRRKAKAPYRNRHYLNRRGANKGASGGGVLRTGEVLDALMLIISAGVTVWGVFENYYGFLSNLFDFVGKLPQLLPRCARSIIFNDLARVFVD